MQVISILAVIPTVPRSFLHDPVKQSSRLFHPEELYPEQDTLPDVNEFAKLYFENPDSNFNIFECGDVRKVLNIISRAGCFSYTQVRVSIVLCSMTSQLPLEV